jgi:hypothetical protein
VFFKCKLQGEAVIFLIINNQERLHKFPPQNKY